MTFCEDDARAEESPPLGAGNKRGGEDPHDQEHNIT